MSQAPLPPVVGVLALQGDFAAHAEALRRAGASRVEEVRTPCDLKGVDALVLPGGESTTISMGLARTGLDAGIRARIEGGMPVLGTCAGAILLARHVENGTVPSLEALDITAVRNAYGTQVDSFATTVDAGAADGLDGLRAVFIRAPRLRAPGKGVDVLARVKGVPVLVRQGNLLAATFHPELTPDTRVHRLFLERARKAAQIRQADIQRESRDVRAQARART